MDFDHMGGHHKKNNVSRMMLTDCSLKTIKEEIKKCELVCANCHRIRTFRRRGRIEED
jgi:hypothetical protein